MAYRTHKAKLDRVCQLDQPCCQKVKGRGSGSQLFKLLFTINSQRYSHTWKYIYLHIHKDNLVLIQDNGSCHFREEVIIYGSDNPTEIWTNLLHQILVQNFQAPTLAPR